MIKKNYLLITGGTGGHVIPAVNFGNFLIDNGYKCYLLIDQRGLKYATSFKGEKKIISASHLSRNIIGKFYALILLIFGFFQSLKYIIIIRPSSCVAFGSYASFMPLCVLCFFKFFSKTKIYLHEQNSVLGKVNSFFVPFVNKVFLNFDDTLKLNHKYKLKSFRVGLPSNHMINYKNRKIIVKDTIINKLFICGGSQGAINLNKKILHLLSQLPQYLLNKFQISIQCPVNQIKEIKEYLEKISTPYELKSFFVNFEEKLYETDLLISRAGAGTINDVILTQTPTIFIPLPSSTNQHQFYNANYLNNKNAAVIIAENELNSNESMLIIKKFISEIEPRSNLIKNLQKINIFDTNQLIYKHLHEI